MKKRYWIPLVVLGMLAVLWVGGVIPRQMAKAAGTNYVQEHFPEMQLVCTDVTWSRFHGDYLITFESAGGDTYGCVIGPKYFPVSMGQGLFAIESDYKAQNKK